MNEVRALIEAFDVAVASGERCSLATIVSVEGSSYRSPGARMLVREDGGTTGTISAGCLENDVIEHAKTVIRTGRAKLVEYKNESTSDEMAWGLGLGCNGIVCVLVEPLAPDSPYAAALRRTSNSSPDAPPTSVATVCEHLASASVSSIGIETGARLIIDENGDISRERLTDERALMLENVLLRDNAAGPGTLDIDGAPANVFIETLLPPVPLVIFGAGRDALPIVELAHKLGWQTEVVDTQARPASLSRFPLADRVTLARPEHVGDQVTITPRTLTLVMSHNYSHDLAVLEFLLATSARYVGVMGPRKRTERMLDELAADESFRFVEEELERLYSPVGLDLAANSPAEIAVSIVAEMTAVLNGRRGGMLRDRRGAIHGSSTDAGRDLHTAERVRPVVTA